MRTLTALTIAAALTLSACSGGEDTSADTGSDTSADTTAEDSGDAAAAGGAITFVGTDEVKWAQTEASVAPGSVEVTIECGAAVNHGIGIEGVQGDAELAACDGGGTGSATVDLEAGTYTFFCTVPGHREAGMEGTLTVG